MTNKFKDALDGLNVANDPLTTKVGYQRRALRDDLLGDWVEINMDTIRQALTICQRLMEEPSLAMTDEMGNQLVRCAEHTADLYTHDYRLAFRVMVEQLMKEAE